MGYYVNSALPPNIHECMNIHASNLEVTVSYGADVPMVLQEDVAFESAISPLLATVHGGGAPLRVPEEQQVLVDTEYHAIVNTYYSQSAWFEARFDGKTDEQACNYTLAKLRQRLHDRPLPIERKVTDNPLDVFNNVRDLVAQATPGYTEMVHFDVKQVTCFLDGERRRYVAHFDAVTVNI